MRLWPSSLKGQILMAIALSLLLAQAISAVLIYRAQKEMRESAIIHAAAFRLLADISPGRPRKFAHQSPVLGTHAFHLSRRSVVETATFSPLRSGEAHAPDAETRLKDILGEQGYPTGRVEVTVRPLSQDPVMLARLAAREHRFGPTRQDQANAVLVAAVQRQGARDWRVVRILVPPGERGLILTLIGQTLLIYTVVVGALALILRRITRPLGALTRRLERFADTRDPASPIEPEGPSDVRGLILAHNAMEARIAALIEEKDIMLGAIGHDLKTPLTALRVRIESVEDESERARMAATIEDIVRTLDDILSLARVGRPRDEEEPTELSALVASVVEEFEDLGEPVELVASGRIVVPLRSTWFRRALRNLVGNAVRYGRNARVSLARERDEAVISIADDGSGIPEADIERMQQPFTRGEPSRNSGTGGAGLGLTLARAIAEQHGGRLVLANRRDANGMVAGLTAEIRLPLPLQPAG